MIVIPSLSDGGSEDTSETSEATVNKKHKNNKNNSIPNRCNDMEVSCLALCSYMLSACVSPTGRTGLQHWRPFALDNYPKEPYYG